MIRFRNEKFSEVDRYFRDLDFLSARTILNGLVVYGWTYDELFKCRSDLMTQLFRYVHDQVQTFSREPFRKRPRVELSNRLDADRLYINFVDSDHAEAIANGNSTDDEEINSSTSDNSTTLRRAQVFRLVLKGSIQAKSIHIKPASRLII